MKIDTFKYIKEVLAHRAVDDMNITFSNGETLVLRKNDNEIIVYLEEGYIDVNNGANNKYYSIDQIVSIEKYVPKTAKIDVVDI